MPTASGRTTTSRGPGGPGSGTSSTTSRPGDLVTAASICAGHLLRQAPLKALVRSVRPGSGGGSHPSAGLTNDAPRPGGGFLGPPTAAVPALAGDINPARNLTITVPGVIAKVIYLPGADTVRLPALPG